MRCCFRKHKQEGRSKCRMRPLLFGMLAGLALGIMFAPKPGSETINSLKQKLTDKLPL